MTPPLVRAVEIVGGISAAARLCERSPRAVRKWLTDGLPRTEWTGETRYSEILERETGGQVTKAALLKKRSAA